MAYQCKGCGSSWEHKYLLVRHLKRKHPCDPVLGDVAVGDLLTEFDVPKEKRYKCKHCLKLFAIKQSKYVHQKDCKGVTQLVSVQPTVEQLADMVATLQAELAVLKANKGGQTITNNGTINNTHNNYIQINIRDFGRGENLGYLNSDVLLESLREMNMTKVVEELHFNPEHPENHNVRLKNQNKNQMKYFNEGKWVIGSKDTVLREMAMNGWRVLHSFYRSNKEEIEDELDEDEIREATIWLRKVYDEDKEQFNKIKAELYELVLNNKDIHKVQVI